VSGSDREAVPPVPLEEAVLRDVLAGTPAGIGILGPDLRYRYVNPALAAMNGVPAAAHVGRTITELLPDLDDPGETVLRQVLADGRPRELTSSGHTRAVSGLERRYWHGAYHRLQAADGTVTGIVGIVLEVSASRQEQRGLERARERLTLLDRAATAIGPPLGTGHGGYELLARPYTPGHVLLMYTDGLVERRGEDIDVSLARLAALRLPTDGDIGPLVDKVLALLVTEEAEDDIAVLAARITR
jgi:PAS domain S-box-containing protein